MLNEVVYRLTIAPRLRRLQRLLPEALIHPAGSRYVCNPPVMGTDIDFIIYTPSYDISFQKLIIAGFRGTTDIDRYAGTGNFMTWRRGKVNLIVSNDVEFIEGFQTGVHICKQNNIRDKSSRILIHAAFRKNEYYPDNIKACAIDLKIQEQLASFNGPHGHAMLKIYRAQQGLEL